MGGENFEEWVVFNIIVPQVAEDCLHDFTLSGRPLCESAFYFGVVQVQFDGVPKSSVTTGAFSIYNYIRTVHGSQLCMSQLLPIRNKGLSVFFNRFKMGRWTTTPDIRMMRADIFFQFDQTLFHISTRYWTGIVILGNHKNSKRPCMPWAQDDPIAKWLNRLNLL